MRKAINNRPYIGERGALIVLVLLNSALQLAGDDVLPFTENNVETFLTVAFNFVAMDAAYWKNNSLTEEAKQVEKYMKAKNQSKITKIARHHSATTSGNVNSFQNHWRSLGWKTAGYHKIILRDGTVQLCYDSNVVTNGVCGHNQTSYHICVVGDGSFTAAQERSFEERAKYNLKRFGRKVSDVLGH